MQWDDEGADIVVWTDASLKLALSFYYASNGFVYQLQPCLPTISIDIFFLELVAILSDIHHVASFSKPPRHLLLWTDSLDAVGILNSLNGSNALHNTPLSAISEVILASGLDLCVCHISGKENIHADLLSHLLLDEYQRKFPADHVRIFTPPRDLLPVQWRESF